MRKQCSIYQGFHCMLLIGMLDRNKNKGQISLKKISSIMNFKDKV